MDDSPAESAQVSSQDHSYRGRISNACTACRTHKIRCAGSQPCSSCAKHGRECLYAILKPRGRRKKLRHEVAPLSGGSTPARHPTRTLQGDGEQSDPGANTPRRPGPLATKRQQRLRCSVGVAQSGTGGYQFYGPASNFAFLQCIYQRIHRNAPNHQDRPGAMCVWGFDKFAFPAAGPEGQDHSRAPVCLPKELGDCFIKTYFEVAHPQYPFLLRSEIHQAWSSFWNPPRDGRQDGVGKTARSIVLMVLAIGAHMSSLHKDKDAATMSDWAAYLASRARLDDLSFGDVSLQNVHLLLLKSIFAMQLMRPNDCYLYVGHAAVNALALGMGRAQVANGNRTGMYRLRVTFYTLYAVERLVALFYGRPSCLRDDSIDATLPEDLPENHGGDTICDMSYVRAKAELARIADRINTNLYFCTPVAADLTTIVRIVRECDAELDTILQSLPPFLHFFDTHMEPSTESWQEVQRTHLGLAYYHTRILMHRPSLVWISMCASKAEAMSEARAMGLQDLQASIDVAMDAAKALIALALDACSTRAPEMRQDSGVAYNIIAACLTLLYDVLEGPSRTAAGNAAKTFEAVQDGINCLDFMKHHGLHFGKVTLSSRIVGVAKDAFRHVFDSEVSNNNNEGGSAEASASAPTTEPTSPQRPIQDYPERTNHLSDLDSLLGQFPWLA